MFHISLFSFLKGREKPLGIGSVEKISPHPQDFFVVCRGFPICAFKIQLQNFETFLDQFLHALG